MKLKYVHKLHRVMICEQLRYTYIQNQSMYSL